MSTINLDKFQQKKSDCAAAIMAAAKSQDQGEMEKALTDYAGYLSEAIASAAEMKNGQALDAIALSGRGVRQLTGQETKFYNEFIAAAKSSDVKMAITNMTEAIPVTIIDAVIEDIKKSHPLLDRITFRNSSLFTKYVYNKTGKPTIAWGDINSAITNELSGEIGVVDVNLKKLSAFMYIPNDMLDLGPAWLDTFVRGLLAEYIALGLEAAVVNGDGKNEYIGMTRDVSATAAVVDGVYPLQTATVLTSLDSVSIGNILAELAQDEAGRARKVENPIFVVNPFDYFRKILPATTIRGTDGTYKNNILPYPMEIIQSEALDEGTAVIGLPERYLALMGMGKEGKIEYDDSYKFLEDMRTYRAKFTGNGRPLDSNAFILCDISGLEPAVIEVTVKSSSGE